MKGFVNIFKPIGLTSSDVVVKVRGILGKTLGEKQKTGHLGTLDPLACGVLPIAVGSATKLFDYMLKKTKTYIATFKFGETTNTLDGDGKISVVDNVSVNTNSIIEILPEFIGELNQIPPQYSAKSVNGKRAYDIARSGGTVVLVPKQIKVYNIDLINEDNTVFENDIYGILNKIPPNQHYRYDNRYTNLLNSLKDNEFAFKITCSSGTYIRSIVRDMAERLGTVGYMTSLCRIQTDIFDLNNAVTLEEFEQNPLGFVLPIDKALDGYDIVDLDDIQGNKALNGVKIAYDLHVSTPCVVKVMGELVGLGEVSEGQLKIKTRL